MKDCLFCKIISGEIPSHKVYEDENTFAFLDANPVSSGHTLVLPKKHSKNIFDIDERDLLNLTSTVKKISPIIKQVVNAGGLNISSNNEKDAGQVIFHTHIHIVPRFKNDGYELWKGKPLVEKEGEEIAKKIKENLT